MKYDFSKIEPKWQQVWDQKKLFKATTDKNLPKYYCLEMFPYPSGNIHMGHVRNYVIGDVLSRYKFMQGFNVLHPIGWDAFGLPAENAARQNKKHPAQWTYSNIEKMKSQIKKIGISYDWDREIATCAPEYYKCEQMIFIKLWEKGLAYKKKSNVNWCNDCETVLANEQVEDGKCWRCSNLVVTKELEQWFLKITDYAEELLQETYNLPGWPEKVLTMQRNWIGKSVGAEITFDIVDSKSQIKVFSTRPDTLFGATFMLIAPEHPLAKSLISGTNLEKEGLNFIASILKESKENRTDDKEKEGFFTGKYCINPVTQKNIPIYIANYVLMEYGTGAVMAVPAHDQRDFEFAKKYKLPIHIVIQTEGEKLDADNMKEAYSGAGVLVNSSQINGLDSEKAKEIIIKELEGKGAGKTSVTYRLRDWGVSRQRYWGAPLPFVHCSKCGLLPVKESDLPVRLPENVDFTVQGNPLDFISDFVNTNCPKCGGAAKRETDTMDTFMESSWYFMRYCSPKCDTAPFEKNDVDYFMPVDQYIGGVEHAVMHLLYARFYTKVLRDLGYISFSEPFTNLLTQGMVCKETQKCPNDGWLFPHEVIDEKCTICGADVETGRIEKMSKSKKNVIDPDELVNQYGADTLRLFSLFAAPPENEIQWSDSGVEGGYRFINRVYRLILNHIELLKSSTACIDKPNGELSTEIIRHTHVAIKRVTVDIERFQLNTAVAAIMEFVNALYNVQDKIESDTDKGAFKNAILILIKLCTPLTPHLAEELWEKAGMKGFVSREKWPTYVDGYTIQNEVTIVVQINGKVRAELSMKRDCTQEEAFDAAFSNEKVLTFLEGKEIVKKIFVPGKLVSIVIK